MRVIYSHDCVEYGFSQDFIRVAPHGAPERLSVLAVAKIGSFDAKSKRGPSMSWQAVYAICLEVLVQSR